MKKIYAGENASDIDTYIKEHDELFIYFYTEWCGESKMDNPIVEELEEKWKDKINFAKIDVDDEYLWSGEKNGKFEILNVPTFIYFRNGKEIWRDENFKDFEMLDNVLNKIINEK